MDRIELPDDEAVRRIVHVTSTPRGVRELLLRSPSVVALRRAVEDGRIAAEWCVVQAVSALQQVTRGQRLEREPAICATIVALESMPQPAVQQFLESLSVAGAQEFSMATRIARLALEMRRRSLSANTMVVTRLSPGEGTGASFSQQSVTTGAVQTNLVVRVGSNAAA